MYAISGVQFADANGSSIAYMSYGDGPVTICAVPPMAQNIELAWDVPHIRRMFDGFAAFSRQIMFDKRGTGMSDRSLDIPSIDERVDELKAVMDHADVDRAFVHGVSEGGPMAIMFAATYPDRVEGLILEGTGASLINDQQREELRSPGGLEIVRARWGAFANAWGTTESLTPPIFAPSLIGDPDFMSVWPRYERQSANRDALTTLFEMNGQMDARGVLQRVEAPVLILHRRDDTVVPFERAEETHRLLEAAGVDVTLLPLEGRDHFTFAVDLDPVMRAIEQFTTGAVTERPARPQHRVEVCTLGSFEVRVDGEPVATNAWGSKRARTLLKRLIVARGWPLTRLQLIELLWPGEPSDRLNARLSVQLSAVRRVLHGAIIADRETVRLELGAVEIDIEQWCKLPDDDEIIDTYRGEFLPEERYEDWAGALRDELRLRYTDAVHRRAAKATAHGAHHEAAVAMRLIVAADPFDSKAHVSLVRALHLTGNVGAARLAYETYAESMKQLEVSPDSYEELVS